MDRKTTEDLRNFVKSVRDNTNQRGASRGLIKRRIRA
jgi:hypothetical protein